MEDLDACNWSSSEVAYYVQNQLPRDIARIPHVSDFDAQSLAAKLLEDDVNGFTLLDDVNKKTLKEDYGIRSASVRSAISRAIDDLRRKSSMFARLQDGSQSSDATFSQHQGSQHAPPARSPVPLALSQAPPSELVKPPPVTPRVGTNVRGKEYIAEDSYGRKRRKLELPQPATVEPVVSPALDTGIEHSTRQDLGALVGSYLPDHAIRVDELIYGETLMGEDVDLADPEYHCNDDTDFYFMTDGQITDGQRYCINRRIQDVLKGPKFRNITFHGRPAVAAEYINEDQLPAGVPLSTTVYQQQADGKVTAARSNAALLRFQEQESINLSDFRGTEYEHFLHRHDPDNDNVISDDDQSTTSSLIREIEQDQKDAAEEATKNMKLTKEQAREVVDAEIEAIATKWKSDKEPVHEKKHAWKVWKEIRGKGTIRMRLMDEAKAVIAALKQRLDKYTAELVASEWSNELELRKECRILDVTVQDMSEKSWRLDVLQRREEPENSPRIRRRNNRRRSQAGQSFQSSNMEDFIKAEERVQASSEDDDLDLIYRNHQPNTKFPEREQSNNQSPPGMIDHGDLDAGMGSDRSPANAESRADSDPMDESSDHFVNAQESLDLPNSDSEGDLPSPSQLRDRLHADQAARKVAKLVPETIVLSSDPPSPDVLLPTPNKASSLKSLERQKKLFDNPQEATKEEIKAWDWSLLESEDNPDELNNAVLAKLIHELDSGARRAILKYLHSTNITTCIRDVQRACDMLPNEPMTFGGKSVDTSRAITYAARLFLCWHNARKRYWSDAAEDCAKKMVRPPTWEDPYMRRWYNIMKACLQKAESSVITIDDSDDEVVPSFKTPNKKRKRRVGKDRNAQSLRQRALDRAAFSQQGSDTGQLSQMISAGINTGDEIAIYAPDGIHPSQHVYLNKDLARRLKPHQVEGIRFMWREITVPDDEDGQGCLLAHTMGLGKTAQTIGLLVTLAETIALPDKLELVPKSLHEMRILILCPPALINNWRQEIDQWDRGNMLGNVYSVDSVTTDKISRLNELRMWSKAGGVLLIGYSMFGRLVSGAATAPANASLKPEKAFTAEEKEEMEDILLDRPTLVVADEAHMLKNERSKVASAAAQIATQRRIGLTGSPMSNNTQEIYALISWVAPKYLGTAQEFRAHYAEPIEQGTYLESTAYEKRKSMVKLAALNRIIGPKLNRADITVLKGSIKQKVEFVLTVPLTDVQVIAYERFVTNLLPSAGKEGKLVTQAKLFGWLAMLTLLCNHPWMFMRKLKEKPLPPLKRKAAQNSSTADTGISEPSSRAESPTERLTLENGEEAAPGDEHVSALEIHETMVEKICEGLPEGWDTEGLSYKVELVERIIRLSIISGDKILLFSHSIPSLDFLEKLLQKNRWNFARIDGSVKQQTRIATLDNMKRGQYDVLLISTRAGGLGLNIQTANRVIIFDFGFNPTWEEQAIGRAYRLGQQKPVYVYRFVAGGTFESMLYNKAIFKTSLASRVVDKKNPERNALRKPAEWLYPPRTVVQDDILVESGKDPLVLDMILAEHAQHGSYIRAIKTMETLQRDANDEPLTEEEQKQVEAEIQNSLVMMGKAPPPPPLTPRFHGPPADSDTRPAAPVGPPSTAPVSGPVRTKYNPYTGYTRVLSSAKK